MQSPVRQDGDGRLLITAEFELNDTPELDAFNDWYSRIHVADFLAAPGIVSGRRFYRSKENGQVHFVAMYEHDGSNHPRDSFESIAGSYAVDDFKARFPEYPMPRIRVFHEIPVGPEYEHWRHTPLTDEGA